MEAAVGDRIVVAAAMLSGPLRDGEIIQVGKQGEPPYLVRWSDDGRETLFFPGPDAHISHHHESVAESPATPATRRVGSPRLGMPHPEVKTGGWICTCLSRTQQPQLTLSFTPAPRQSWIVAERPIRGR
jgi:hypothetical protein